MAQSSSQPNIIVFLVDDMGWQDTSVPFHSSRTPLNAVYETPNMERLASRGMRFSNAYACSVSTPSRVSLLTGMNAARHRVTNWTLRKNTSTDRVCDILDFPAWNVNGITQFAEIENTCQVTPLPQILKNNGYHTILCGKAHFGAINTPGENPYHLGFDVNIAGHAGGGIASYLGEENFGNKTDGTQSTPQAVPGLEKYWGKDIFATEALTLEAIQSLDKALLYGQPFFLYMAHYAIHIPINKDKRFYQKHIDKGLDPKEAAYAALIEGMDVSFVPFLKATEKHKYKKRSLFWNYPNLWDGDGLGVGPACTIRKGNWKLIYHYDTGVKELYNLNTDIGENNNLIDVEIDTAKKLSGELSRYLRKVKAQRPTNKTTGKSISWPDGKEQ